MKTALVMLVTIGLLLAGCAGAGQGTSAGPSPATANTAASPAAASPAPAPGGIFGRALINPAATVTGNRLYVLWQLNPDSAAPPRIVIARVDRATGAIEATHRFAPGYAGPPLAAGGWLWVPTSTAAGQWLLRLNPVSLAVTEQLRTGNGFYPGSIGPADHLAVAGGGLWAAAGGRLLRVSLPGGRVTAVIPLPGAFTSGVAASADGSVLVVSEANSGGAGSLQRRDPVTGALLASHPVAGVTAPEIGGVIDSGAWVAEATGMLGYVERFGVATMTPDPATEVGGTNAIRVGVADGMVWIMDPMAGRNYCANPLTTQRLATIPLPDLYRDYLLAVAGRVLYYAAPGGGGLYLRVAAVPAACRG